MTKLRSIFLVLATEKAQIVSMYIAGKVGAHRYFTTTRLWKAVRARRTYNRVVMPRMP